MPPPPTIRPATPHDIPAMTGLLAELNREEGYTTSINAATLGIALFGENRRTIMRALVAAPPEEGEAIGMALYYWGFDTVSSSYGFHLADIVVTQQWRGKGIGKRLMQTLAAHCLNEGGQWISLTVLKQNTAAKKFYTTLTMSQVGVDFFAIGPQALSTIAAPEMS